MANGKVSSARQKVHYTDYKGRYAKNRRARLERHLKKFPNDTVAQEALKGDLSYRRKTPISRKKVWTPGRKRLAHLYRIAGMDGNKALLTRQEKEQAVGIKKDNGQ